MTITLTIPRLPLSGNQTRKFSGWERQEYRTLWHQEVWVAWRKWQAYVNAGKRHYNLDYYYPSALKKAKVTFTVFFKDKRKHDKINTAEGLKGALDGLVLAGIIEDDENYPNKKCDDFYVLEYDKEHPRTEIEVEELK